MRSLIPTFILLLLVTTTIKVRAEAYVLDSEHSTVSFATTKLSYVIEPAFISALSGQIDASGNLNIKAPIGHIETGVSIRNERLNKLFFLSDVFPDAMVVASVPDNVLSSEALITQQTLPAIVSISGNQLELNFTVNIVKLGKVISVSTAKPTIVNASAFGIPASHLTSLAKTVGGIPIADTVPVSFSIIFVESD